MKGRRTKPIGDSASARPRFNLRKLYTVPLISVIKLLIAFSFSSSYPLHQQNEFRAVYRCVLLPVAAGVVGSCYEKSYSSSEIVPLLLSNLIP